MDKQSVIQDYRAAYGEFKAAVDGLSDEQMTKPAFGEWSLREVLGHIGGWHEKMAAGVDRMGQGQRPVPEGENWNDIDGMNAGFARSVAGRSPAELLSELETRVTTFAAALQKLPDDRFGEKKTANTLAAGAGYEHFREHAHDIKEARETGKL